MRKRLRKQWYQSRDRILDLNQKSQTVSLSHIYRVCFYNTTVSIVTMVTPTWVTDRQHSASVIVYSGGERNSDAEKNKICSLSRSPGHAVGLDVQINIFYAQKDFVTVVCSFFRENIQSTLFDAIADSTEYIPAACTWPMRLHSSAHLSSYQTCPILNSCDCDWWKLVVSEEKIQHVSDRYEHNLWKHPLWWSLDFPLYTFWKVLKNYWIDKHDICSRH